MKGEYYMASTSMNIRIDSEVKKQAEELFAEFGLSMTAAVNMFLRQSIRKQAIPFELALETSSAGDKGKTYPSDNGENSKKDLLDLFGKIQFAEGYDYKALREGR